jgi:transcriptional regulator with XRE-family HTH domain
MPNRHRTTEELAFNRTVGNNIKYLRKIRNFTQSRVARDLDCTFQQIQKYEKGSNGVSGLKLQKLAKLFDIKTDVIIDPNFIPYHKGFTGKMDWLQHEAEIEEEQKRQAYRKEFMEENKDVNHKA